MAHNIPAIVILGTAALRPHDVSSVCTPMQ